MRPISTLLCLCLVAVTASAADLEFDKPYDLHIVLDIARHRLLTPVYKETVKRELQDGLRTAFGDLARVKIVEEHPKLDEVRKNGMGKPLDDWRELTGVKTHFVRVDFDEGQYVVQTRQHDGYTGIASPVLRREKIADRLFVARLATFLIDRDFGLVGQITDKANTDKIRVAFKGGGLGVPLTRWLKKDEVLRFAPVTAGGAPRRVGESVLQITDVDDAGSAQCRFWSSVKKPFLGDNNRALHIHTVQGPLRVQLLYRDQEKTKTARRTPAAGQAVTIRRHGFAEEEVTKLDIRSDADGALTTENDRRQLPFDRLAFLSVPLDDKRVLTIPLALTDDRPIVVGIPARRQSTQTLLQIRKEISDQQAEEAGMVQKDLFRELKELEAKANLRDKALKRAREGLAASQDARKQLASERADLLKAAEEAKEKLDTGYADQWLKYLDAGNTQLEAYIKEQERIAKEENDPRKVEYQALKQQARLEEARAEFAKALELYARASKFGFNDPQLDKDYASLKKRWEPKNEEHRKARQWMETTFASGDLLKTPALMKEAIETFHLFRREKDILGCQKLAQVLLAHAGKLKEQKERLEPDVNEEDRKALEVLADVSADLRKLGLDIQAFVGDNTK